MSERGAVSQARRVVIKIGSSALRADVALPGRLAEVISEHSSHRFVIVSSGAIAIGAERLGYDQRPKEMSRLQAAAAAGQSVLMRRYDEAFQNHGCVCGQVLLTHADLADRSRLNNARGALASLMEAGAVPIANENDTVATEEIAFGDNDQLAAMVAPLVSAELLVLLTDVDGVMNEGGQRMSELGASDAVPVLSGGSAHGSGGIRSKVDAARKAARAGASVVIASAARAPLSEVLSGNDVGTYVPAATDAMRARQHWIAYTLRPRGALLLDDGAATAVRAGRSSLLPIGIAGVRGDFVVGDSVVLLAPDGQEVARGLTRMGASEVARVAKNDSDNLQLRYGERDWVVVHRDDLVFA